jgi:hypothetical protein
MNKFQLKIFGVYLFRSVIFMHFIPERIKYFVLNNKYVHIDK